jgi:hypothetical protein
VAGVLSLQAIDGLIADAADAGIGLDGGGLLQQMMKAVL